MVKELLITVFYFSGAFAVGFDSNGINKIQPCTWYEPIQQATGVKVRIHKSYRRRHFAPELQRLEDWQKLSHRTFAFMARQKVKGIRLAFLPPLVDLQGRRYMAGLAQVCRPLNGLAVVNALETRTDGSDGIYPSTIIAQHELAHTLGATHTDEVPNVMHSWAGHYATTQKLTLLEKSKKQMKGCLARYGFYKRKAK